MNEGKKIFGLIRNLFPINRSLTGEGVRKTLKILKTVNSKLKVQQINSGTKVFDWVVPKEWSIKEAFIKDSKGNKICDFKKNNLHLLGYSMPVDNLSTAKANKVNIRNKVAKKLGNENLVDALLATMKH